MPPIRYIAGRYYLPPPMLTIHGKPIQREMTFYDRDGIMVNVIEQDIEIPLT